MKNGKPRFDLLSDNAVLLYFSFLKFLLLLIFAGNYGLFRDELYYLECSKHLDWGYVDQPPLSLLLLAASRTLFGESILGIKIFAYLAGSAVIFITGLIAREMGGNKFAQALAALSAVFSGVLLGGSGYFSMNAFDLLFASLMFYVLIRLIKSDNPKMWIWLGVIFGIGLQNKLTFLFLAFGLAVSLLITKERKYFLTKELYIGAAIAGIIFLPHVIWQIANGFPTIEFMHNAAALKNIQLGIAGFSFAVLMELNPFYVVLLAAGFYFLFFHAEGKRFVIIAWMFIVIFLVFLFNNGKSYYMGVLFPVILAAGALGAERLIERYSKNWAKYALILLLIPSFIIVPPFAVPILDVETFIKFSAALGIEPPRGERSRLGVLPQFFADRFGWQEMTEKVASVYNKLTDEEKKKVLIFGQNYGEASAVNFYGRKFGLPHAVTPHNSYWMWGYPESWDGEAAIIIGSSLEDNSEFFEQVELAAAHSHKYGMPYENVDIFLCRKIKVPMNQAWKRIKRFI